MILLLLLLELQQRQDQLMHKKGKAHHPPYRSDNAKTNTNTTKSKKKKGKGKKRDNHESRYEAPPSPHLLPAPGELSGVTPLEERNPRVLRRPPSPLTPEDASFEHFRAFSSIFEHFRAFSSVFEHFRAFQLKRFRTIVESFLFEYVREFPGFFERVSVLGRVPALRVTRDVRERSSVRRDSSVPTVLRVLRAVALAFRAFPSARFRASRAFREFLGAF